ncbi:MAG: hypothetical protein P8189_32320 [Anaerolineae bacterium]
MRHAKRYHSIIIVALALLSSAGSTSPAWSFLLSVSYLLGLDYRLWAYLWGGLSLAATAWLVYRLAHRLVPSKPTAALLTGLFCAVEWHLVWAAASGMETMLFTALSLALLEYYFSQMAARQSPQGPVTLQMEQTIVSGVGIGLLGGILTLTRPEGLALTGLVLIALVILPISSWLPTWPSIFAPRVPSSPTRSTPSKPNTRSPGRCTSASGEC